METPQQAKKRRKRMRQAARRRDRDALKRARARR